MPASSPLPSLTAMQADTNTPQAALDTSTPNPTRSATLEEQSTSAPMGTPALADTSQPAPVNQYPHRYYTQAGDTLPIIAARFGVQVEEILSLQSLPAAGLLDPGQLLLLPPRRLEMISDSVLMQPSQRLLPDSEIVNGPSAVDFDVAAYLKEAGGYLGTHKEYLGSTAWTDAADVIVRIGLENSVNPRLLLALLEHECGCVSGQEPGGLLDGYALGVEEPNHRGLYGQLGWAANELSIGYYGWRTGTLREIPLPNGFILRPAPDVNAGSVALYYYFASLASQKALHDVPHAQREILGPLPIDDAWLMDALDPVAGFAALHRAMFGDPWTRALTVEPIFSAGFQQLELILPFEPGVMWSYASGPHKAWQTEGALAALDFAPASAESECVRSDAWVVAVADGPIVRDGIGFVIQDLDPVQELDQDLDPDQDLGLAAVDMPGHARASDEREQIGWAILYMHVESRDRVPVGTYLQVGDRIGHPSCEGGMATGTHMHIARKYNGEWIDAGGALPFVLSGWTAQAGAKPLEGTLVKDDLVVIAHPYGSYETLIYRPEEDAEEE